MSDNNPRRGDFAKSLRGVGPDERIGWTPEQSIAAFGYDINDETLTVGGTARAAEWAVAIPSRYLWATLDPEATGEEAKLGEWADRPGQRNLVLLGPVGTGKSYSAVAACRPSFDTGRDVLFCPVVELLDDLRPDGPRDTMENAREVDILVLDDLGAEKPSEWTAERLYAIVNRRWMEERPTVATSNYPIAELRERVGERMWSRLVGNDAVVVGLTGNDRRAQ